MKGFVKWQVDGAAGPTYAQLTLRRFGKDQFGPDSLDPWKKPVYLPFVTFAGTCPSSEIKQDFDVHSVDRSISSNSFWKPGKKGDSVEMFYSLIGPKGSTFKINELEMDVYVRDVGKTETSILKCNPQYKQIGASRGKQKFCISEAVLAMPCDRYVLSSIKGHVKWKATQGATLILKLFKGGTTYAHSELELAEIKPDASSECTNKFEFTFEKHCKESVFEPRARETGDAVVLEVQLPGGSALEIQELNVTVISKPFFEKSVMKNPVSSVSRKGKLRAFVVGISEYIELQELPNAVNDARAIVETLKDRGVPEEDIVAIENCHSFSMNDAFDNFVKLCYPGDFAFMFFAGHGCAFKNYQCLLARALRDKERADLNNRQYQFILQSSLQVDNMLATLREKGVTRHLLLLDCCREVKESDLSRKATDDPLAKAKPERFNITLGAGTTIGYATSPGDLAYSPKESLHGYYTQALMKHLYKINTDVDYMLREVGAEVVRMTKGKQNPYRSSCLNEPDAYLFEC